MRGAQACLRVDERRPRERRRLLGAKTARVSKRVRTLRQRARPAMERLDREQRDDCGPPARGLARAPGSDRRSARPARQLDVSRSFRRARFRVERALAGRCALGARLHLRVQAELGLWPSDNALLFPAGAGRVLFDWRLPDLLNEWRLAHAAGMAGLRFCWVRVDVWLFKPERAVLGTNEGSVGVRRWTTPTALRAGANGSAPQSARNYDPSIRVHERAKHAAWDTYAKAPLAWVAG